MQIFNTLGRVMAPLDAGDDGAIGIYVCGPTVQAKPHLGHGRSAIAFDVIRRYLTWRGFSVKYVRNVTDVEDKIIAVAQSRNVSTDVIVSESFATFSAAEAALGVLPPDVEPRATEHIPEMIELIATLVDAGLAYPSDGDVYFRVRAYPDYGKLSGRDVDDLLSGARVEVGEAKEDPLDFALWKAAKPGEPTWESPWGLGRPGWHIECSAMARKHLGDTVDIHGGGTDLIFPHHENELAQSEGATGKLFARFWVHNGMLTLGGEKMAKSTGHVIGLMEAIETYNPLPVRLFYLRAHYRSLLEYSPPLLEDAVASYARLASFVRRAEPVLPAEPDAAVMGEFTSAMDDDFNTPVALSVLFETIRKANRRFDSGESPAGLAAAVVEILGVLGLQPPTSISTSHDDQTVAALLAEREDARHTKNWARSDEIRDELLAQGIVLEDTADGTRWHRQ